jgi:hypothetical protein
VLGWPRDWRPQQVRHPETREPFTLEGAWDFIADCLESGCAVEEITLENPPGKTGYVMLIDIGSDRPLLYVKLELGSGTVIGRSFHYSVSPEVRSDA